MPSITTYSPYETLAFIQSVAENGTDLAAFQNISGILTQNHYIRENETFDEERLSATQLQQLYEDLISAERDGVAAEVNGEGLDGERSTKRRKLSPSPASDGVVGERAVVKALIERLYTTYKSHALAGIRSEEQAYAKIQDEIEALEREDSKSNNTDKQPFSPVLTAPETLVERPPSRLPNTQAKLHDFFDAPQQTPGLATPASTNLEKSAAPTPERAGAAPQNTAITSRGSVAAPVVLEHTPGAHDRPAHPQLSQLRSQASPRPPSQPLAPQTHALTHRQNSNQQFAQQTSNQGRGSPLPPQAQPQYPPYPQYHQWHPHMPAQPYPPVARYPPAYHASPVPGRPGPTTPQQINYQQHPHTAPVAHHLASQGWHGQYNQPHAKSAASTPTSGPISVSVAPPSGSSTPWRKSREAVIPQPSSPRRPEREVSPLTDRDTPTPERSRNPTKLERSADKPLVDDTPVPLQPRSGRRGRPPSSTPSGVAARRSQSIASRTSETPSEKPGTVRRGQKIKVEQPSTPLAPPPDPEAPKSTGRRGRPRGGTVTSQAQVSKRKRDSPTVSPTPEAVHTGSSAPHSVYQHDPRLVVVSRNFAKTAQLLLNDITSHKLAGIFAKPLSERDAPGYKDLVLRPQDLKSVKAAVSKGSRAALAVIDSLDEDAPARDDATPRPGHPSSHDRVGAIGNGFYLVPLSPDLVPPKGIVNSSQLEMELVRMFANAVMFNPLPTSERGFGRRLRPRKDGRHKNEIATHVPRRLTKLRDQAGIEDDNDSDPDDARGDQSHVDGDNEQMSRGGSTSGDQSSVGGGHGWDEGGIISDAREMFDDVVEKVFQWRALEEERMMAGAGLGAGMNLGGKEIVHTRQTSVGASSNVEGEELDLVDTPIVSTGPGRKRRRLDH